MAFNFVLVTSRNLLVFISIQEFSDQWLIKNCYGQQKLILCFETNTFSLFHMYTDLSPVSGVSFLTSFSSYSILTSNCWWGTACTLIFSGHLLNLPLPCHLSTLYSLPLNIMSDEGCDCTTIVWVHFSTTHALTHMHARSGTLWPCDHATAKDDLCEAVHSSTSPDRVRRQYIRRYVNQSCTFTGANVFWYSATRYMSCVHVLSCCHQAKA